MLYQVSHPVTVLLWCVEHFSSACCGWLLAGSLGKGGKFKVTQRCHGDPWQCDLIWLWYHLSATVWMTLWQQIHDGKKQSNWRDLSYDYQMAKWVISPSDRTYFAIILLLIVFKFNYLNIYQNNAEYQLLNIILYIINIWYDMIIMMYCCTKG